jgi:hypothetical protein
MVRKPLPDEEYITVADNNGRQRIQHVEWVVDIRKEQVYLTSDGLVYAEDSLRAKGFYDLIGELEQVSAILIQPELVIRDHTSPDDTLIYYKQIYVRAIDRKQLMAVVVKLRAGVKFFYNMHPQESGKVKGYRESVPPELWLG